MRTCTEDVRVKMDRYFRPFLLWIIVVHKLKYLNLEMSFLNRVQFVSSIFFV